MNEGYNALSAMCRSTFAQIRPCWIKRGVDHEKSAMTALWFREGHAVMMSGL